MIRMINSQTGTEMWVAENRLEEYKAAGHRLAAKASETVKPAEKPKKAEKKTGKKK